MIDVEQILRSTKLLGVCQWLSEKSNIDVKHVRIIFIIVFFLGFGFPFLLYLFLFILKEFIIK